jgi:hypothetical protein
MESIATTIRENKLRTIGAFWLVGITGAFAAQTMSAGRAARSSASVRVIHSRLYAQAATLAALVAAAGVEYYEGGVLGKRVEELDPYAYKGRTRKGSS